MGCCAGAFDLDPGLSPSISASDSESESKSSCAFLGCGLFLEARREGNGWLMERPWLGGRANSPGRCATAAGIGAGAGAGAGTVGIRSEGIWEASTRLGPFVREGGGTGFRGIILIVGRGELSSEGRGCICGRGGSGGSRCGGRGAGAGAASTRCQLGDDVGAIIAGVL